MCPQASGNGAKGNGNKATTDGASTNGSSALPEEDSTGVRRLLKLLKVHDGMPCLPSPAVTMTHGCCVAILTLSSVQRPT